MIRKANASGERKAVAEILRDQRHQAAEAEKRQNPA